MHHDVTRLNRLISDISNASRLDAELSREEIGTASIGKLLTQLAEAHRVTIENLQSKRERLPGELPPEKKIVLKMDSADSIFVRGSEHRLAQVFENLLSNALSFSPPEGAVTITVTQSDDRVLVSVSDQGPGIPEAKLESIFERFYTERPKHEDYGSHSGLGLSIARQIVTALGGVIYAENIADADGTIKGARFSVIFNRT